MKVRPVRFVGDGRTAHLASSVDRAGGFYPLRSRVRILREVRRVSSIWLERDPDTIVVPSSNLGLATRHQHEWAMR